MLFLRYTEKERGTRMESTELFQLCTEALYALIIISTPVMMTALVVGLLIALLQAVTQIQEATLTFVPKILAVFLALAVAMPFMLQTLTNLTHKLQDRIVHIE
jgi:flagellar biosynthetic protein FliQ